MLKRITIALLMVSLSAMSAQAAAGLGPYDLRLPTVEQEKAAPFPAVWRLAQVGAAQQAQQPPARVYSMADGMMEGEMYAERIGTGGNFAVGLLCGTLVGLIGTGLCWALTGPASMSRMQYQAMEGKGSDYRLGFETGFAKKSKSRKRGAALGGGLLGTLAFLVLYLNSQ